ncbi:GM25668 [Drosophila sechellia]|uniref:GM25668 n=1 Tax=Drosophila sechellia TaxID=7238 RepID=B4HK81_DROSE|nr:GM25668 [Drosophila sechellia]
MTPSPTKELMSATPTISRRPREEFAEKHSPLANKEAVFAPSWNATALAAS